MADAVTGTTGSAFGQRIRDVSRNTADNGRKKRSSLIRRDRVGGDFELPKWVRPASLALLIVPAPFLAPFFWPGAPGSFDRGHDSAAASPSAAFVATLPVKAGDAEMDAAIARARAGLAAFLDKLEDPAPGERGFALKVALPTDTGSLEHIWTANVTRVGTKFQGRIVNAPVAIRSVRAGSIIEFEDGQISDWMYRREGRIVGNETLRPLLKALPEVQAAQYRAMLASR